MKRTINLAAVLGLLLAVGLACEFSTANLKEINFSSDYDNKKTITSAKLGETVYAHSTVRNTSGKHTVEWVVTSSNGEEISLPQNKVELEGSKAIWLTLKLNRGVFQPGKYSFEVKLYSASGEKVFDTKTSELLVIE